MSSLNHLHQGMKRVAGGKEWYQKKKKKKRKKTQPEFRIFAQTLEEKKKRKVTFGLLKGMIKVGTAGTRKLAIINISNISKKAARTRPGIKKFHRKEGWWKKKRYEGNERCSAVRALAPTNQGVQIR